MQNPSTPNSKTSWTILSILKWTASYFSSNGIEDGRIDAEVLLAHVLASSRLDLYLHYDQPLTRDELKRFKGLIRRRVAREPVAYILGQKEFWSLCFSVSPNVLIPRPETECLVEAALKIVKQSNYSFPWKILELGTGSGAIIVALASEMARNIYMATDQSLDAVRIARHNSRQLLPDDMIQWVVGNWLDSMKVQEGLFDLILSNPPYIQKALIEKLQPEVCRFEPLSALDGGIDGLDCFRRIIPTASRRLSSGGYLLLEIGFDQKDAVAGIANDCGCFKTISFQKDYSGHDRIAVFRLH